MKPDEAEKLHKEVTDEIDNLENKGKTKPEDDTSKDDEHEDKSAKRMVTQLFNSVQFWKHQSLPPAKSESPEKSNPNQALLSTSRDQVSAEEGDSSLPEEPQTKTTKFLVFFKVFINTFGLIFLAEWGDRSQLSTIVLATSNDVGGIILGGCLGHVVCTTIAVIAGALVGRWISVRVVTIIGGIVFIAFAIATLVIGFEDPSTVEISL